MILIPEIETVLIMPPRTASESLKRAVLNGFSKSMLVYRHMEADGIPAGYDRWRKVGVLRHPVERLWSLYKFCKTYHTDNEEQQGWGATQRASTECSFEDWLLHNETMFCQPHRPLEGRYYPGFAVKHSLPENKKSQFLYLRPDLGTQIFRYEDQLHDLEKLLRINMGRTNTTTSERIPPLRPDTAGMLLDVFKWDFEAGMYRTLGL